MAETYHFGAIVLVVAVGFAVAVLSHKLADLLPIPAPALFLIAAAIASHAFPSLGRTLSIRTVERIAVVALVLILFDGGLRVGWSRVRESLAPIVALGTLGTFGTAGIVAVVAHVALGFGWTTAGILGAALAPTDPAVMFSVLGRQEIGGRSGTILEGESGANDPVGIALMLGMLDLATHPGSSFWLVVREFAIGISVGVVVGALGVAILLPLLRHVALPNPALYPLRTLAFAGVVYGLASVLHGSGFLAVYVAGILIGDADVPHKREAERFHTSLASLAEIVVFVALGLTVGLTDLGRGRLWLDGLALAAVVVLVARPLAAGPLLLLTRLRTGERLFVLWGGLKGAVPILLGAFALLAGVGDARRVYGIVFVVVAFSVVVQGGSVPWVARRLGVPMQPVD